MGKKEKINGKAEERGGREKKGIRTKREREMKQNGDKGKGRRNRSWMREKKGK